MDDEPQHACMNVDTDPAPEAHGPVPTPEEVPAMTVERACKLLGISRSSGYAAAISGDLPVITIGRRKLVPTAQLRRMLRLDSEGSDETAA